MMKGARGYLALVAAVIGIVSIFASCDQATGTTQDEEGVAGFVGTSLSLSGPIRYFNKTAFETPDTDGTLSFDMSSNAAEIATATVTGGDFAVTIGTPDSSQTMLWSDILPAVTPTALTISDTTAKGCIIDSALYDRTSPTVTDDIQVLCINYDETTIVYYAYTDKDLSISGSGTFAGMFNTTSIDMDVSLKAGWNRIILTISGTTATFRMGEMPADAYWAYGL